MMKKLFQVCIALCLVLALLFSFASCGGKKSSETTASESQTEQGVGDGADDDGLEENAQKDGESDGAVKQDADGMYTYSVCGCEVRCKNDVYSFMKDNIYDFRKMATASGYSVIEKSDGELAALIAKKITPDGEIGVKLEISSTKSVDTSGKEFKATIGVLVYNGSTCVSQVLQNNPEASTYSEQSITYARSTMDQIVLLEYALENAADNINAFNFGNVLPNYETVSSECKIP